MMKDPVVGTEVMTGQVSETARDARARSPKLAWNLHSH